MHGEENDYFTVRHISKRDYYDQGSDYNPGGYDFIHKIKSLNWACNLGQTHKNPDKKYQEKINSTFIMH